MTLRKTALKPLPRNWKIWARTVHKLPFDVTDADLVSQKIDTFEAGVGPIDILVNNAGMQYRAPLEDFPEDKFDFLMKLNVNSVFYVSKAIAKHMIERKAGKIVNICSVQTALARPSIAPYTGSKGAVANLTKGNGNRLGAPWSTDQWSGSGLFQNRADVCPGRR